MTNPPRLGDILFREDKSNPSANVLRFSRQSDSGYYESGYRKAAEILAHHIGRHRKRDGMLHQFAEVEFLIYPLVYLYRHHIELTLKAIATSVAKLRGGQVPSMTHRLDVLWKQLRR